MADDGDFVKPAKDEEYISVLNSIPDLFKTLGLEVEAPSVEAFLKSQHDELVKLIDSELNDWGLEAYDIERIIYMGE